MRRVKVRANGATFARIRRRIGEDEGGDPSEERMASLIGVGSRNTISRLLQGEEVTYGLIDRIMLALDALWPMGPWDGFNLMDLIADDEQTRIPADPREFPDLTEGHGYYLDFNRRNRGKIEWFHEAVSVGAPMLLGDGDGRFRFEGTIINQNGISFDIVLLRLGDRLCTLHATDTSRRFSFVGTFTHLYGGALCGIWTGLTIARWTAAYRFLLSPTTLDKGQLKAIIEEAKIAPGFTPDR